MRPLIQAASILVCTLLFAAFVALLPGVSLAAEVSAGLPAQAGFPSQPIWLSDSSLTAGESVTISTVLINETQKAITGTLAFTVDGTEISSKQFELAAGKSIIESTAWTSRAGSHEISAVIRDASDSGVSGSISLSNDSAGKRTLTVAEPPPPSQAVQVASAVTNVVSTIIASSSPVVAGVTQTIVQTVESVREKAADYFEKRVAENEKNFNVTSTSNVSGFTGGQTASAAGSDEEGAVLGTSTSRNVAASASLWSRFTSGFDKGALTIFGSAVYFYPFLALIILLILYIVGRRMRSGYRENFRE